MENTQKLIDLEGLKVAVQAIEAALDSVAENADSVSFTQSLTSGTKIGTLTINGTGTDLYAPEGSGSGTSMGSVLIYCAGEPTDAASGTTWIDGDSMSEVVCPVIIYSLTTPDNPSEGTTWIDG